MLLVFVVRRRPRADELCHARRGGPTQPNFPPPLCLELQLPVTLRPDSRSTNKLLSSSLLQQSITHRLPLPAILQCWLRLSRVGLQQLPSETSHTLWHLLSPPPDYSLEQGDLEAATKRRSVKNRPRARQTSTGSNPLILDGAGGQVLTTKLTPTKSHQKTSGAAADENRIPKKQ